MRFEDRNDAGKKLAKNIQLENPKNTIVLALPRGGVPLGLQISKKHNIPFDVIHSKKIVHPLQTEFAIGALAENGEPILNEQVRIDQRWIDHDTERVIEEIARRRKLYDSFLTKQTIEGKDVILVDDGIATGMTMFAAIEAVKKQQPNKVVVAVPVIPKETFYQLEDLVDQVIYVDVPDRFQGAVGAYYRYFPQISDKEIQEMIEAHNA
ncbi:MAG TPA: phosphoribosyltransferase family protein [Atopostipes sp.]|nr:phosphoribosyltransferase family protein [Atopostipes sp.]